MGHVASIEGYRDTLEATAERVYTARREFLRDHFEGYVEDTYYFVPDGGYYCWPAHTNGRFEGFTDLLPGEEAALRPLEEAGFEYLGAGTCRVVYECPPALGENLAVKFGRCGMGDTYGTGRKSNLVEYQISTAVDDLPIIPCLYCDPMGRYALYPKADPVDRSALDSSVASDLKHAIESAVPGLRDDELCKPKNLGRWDGAVHVLDYCEFDGTEYPRGVPDHVDPRAIVREVDELRRRGRKRDIERPGTMVTPSVASG